VGQPCLRQTKGVCSGLTCAGDCPSEAQIGVFWPRSPHRTSTSILKYDGVLPKLRHPSYPGGMSTLKPATRPLFSFGLNRVSSLQDAHSPAPKVPQTHGQEVEHPAYLHTVRMPVFLPRLPCPIPCVRRGQMEARRPASALAKGGIHAEVLRILGCFDRAVVAGDWGGTSRCPIPAGPVLTRTLRWLGVGKTRGLQAQ